MLWPPEAWGSDWEVRNIVFCLESNSCEVHYHDLIAHALSLSTKDVVYFDISVRDVMVMHVLHSLAGLQENYPGDVTQVSRVVLRSYVRDDLGVSSIAFLKLSPLHYLSQGSEFVYSTDFIVAVDYLQAFADVFMVQSLQNVELVLQDVHAAGKISICCEKSLFLKPEHRANLHCVVFSSSLNFKDEAEGSPGDFPDDFKLIVHFLIIGPIGAFEFIGLESYGRKRRVLRISKG